MPGTTTLSSLNRIGIDESGKGDYFGPLVIAAVFVTRHRNRTWPSCRYATVKKLRMDGFWKWRRTSDCFVRTASSPSGHSATTRLYAKINNLNRLLAWGHARALENCCSRSTATLRLRINSGMNG